MAKITLLFANLLLLLGVIGFVVTGSTHYTALIPAGFGVVLELCGMIALVKPSLRMHVMHAAVTLALIGFLGTIPGLIKLAKMLAGTPPERPAAVYAQSIMAGLMLVYVILCVRSFIAARKARKAAATM